MKNTMPNKIAIIGAGYVGLCTGAVLGELGNRILFIDTNEHRVDLINSGHTPVYEPGLDEILSKQVSLGKMKASSNYLEAKGYDFYIISVNTPINADFDVDLTYVKKACEALLEIIDDNSLIMLRSTVPPLTLKNLIVPIFERAGFVAEEDIYFTMVPERLSEGHALRDMKENPVIIGTASDKGFALARKIWLDTDIEFIQTSIEEAELTKLADNLWIDLNIALANEIALVSEKIGADSRKVITAANSLKKGMGHVNILNPGIGVGGSCLPKDPHILSAFSRKIGIELKIPKVSREVNDFMPRHMFELIEKNATQSSNKKVVLIGLSFNSNSGDMRYSPSIHLCSYLKDAGFHISGYDPLVDDNDLNELPGVHIIKSYPEFLANLKEADIFAVVAAHDIFKNKLGDILALAENKLIVDGRYLFDSFSAKKCGARYIAVGVGEK